MVKYGFIKKEVILNAYANEIIMKTIQNSNLLKSLLISPPTVFCPLECAKTVQNRLNMK